MQNVILYLIYTHGKDILTYFYPETVDTAKNDKWEPKAKCVKYSTDDNLMEEENPDIFGPKISINFNTNIST